MKKIVCLLLCLILALGAMPLAAWAEVPDETLLKAPYDLTVTQMAIEGEPYGGVELRFKIDDAPALASSNEENSEDYWLFFERKIGDGAWEEVLNNPIGMFGEDYGFEAPNRYVATETWGEETANMTVSYRVRMVIYDTMTVRATTAWSNVATVGVKASAWALPEVNKAIGYGIVPDSIVGDMTGPITREEFAELAAKLYEVYTGTSAEPAPATTFSDCTNPEVLKAYALGIVNGTGGGKFEPSKLTNREQIAAMLYRAITKIAPDADMSVENAPAFTDAANVASYFLENVKFMGKHEFIKGSGGAFNPKGTCTREMAVLIAVRVYEAYR